MNKCSLCGKLTISVPYDSSKPIICEVCKRKCGICGEPVAVAGHSGMCEKCSVGGIKKR